MKILLADDSMTAQRMGAKILSEAGHEVVAVSNGAAAARKVLEFRPDAVVLDVYMPGYNGLELCERIKKTRETACIPVLLTVGKLEPFRPEEGRRVRADGVVIKPFEASELLRSIGSITGGLIQDSGKSKRSEKASAPAAAADLPHPTAAGIESAAPTPESAGPADVTTASPVAGPADGISAGDRNPVLEIPSDPPFAPTPAPAAFVLEAIEVSTADRESLEARAAASGSAQISSPEFPLPVPEESCASPAPANEAGQAGPSTDSPEQPAPLADQGVPSEAEIAVSDCTPPDGTIPEPFDIGALSMESAGPGAAQTPAFLLEELPAPSVELPTVEGEHCETANHLAGALAEPSSQTQAEPARVEAEDAPAIESSQSPDDVLEPVADLVVDEVPETPTEQMETASPLPDAELPEPAADIPPERSAELAAVAGIVGLMHTAISAEPSLASSPEEPVSEAGSSGLLSSSIPSAPAEIPETAVCTEPAEERPQAPNPEIGEHPLADCAMATPLVPLTEAERTVAPEAAAPLFSEERVAAIVDAVLERLKPQLVAEILRELRPKA